MKVKHIVLLVILFFTIITPWTVEEGPTISGVISIISLVIFFIFSIFTIIENFDKTLKELREDLKKNLK